MTKPINTVKIEYKTKLQMDIAKVKRLMRYYDC